MYVVWKYTLQHGENHIEMPRNPKFLTLGERNGNIVVWALVKPDRGNKPLRVDVVMTGETAPSETAGMYIGTVTAKSLVFHGFWIR